MAQLGNLIVSGVARFLNTIYANDLTVSGTATFDALATTGNLTVGGTTTLKNSLNINPTTATDAVIYLRGYNAIDGRDGYLRLNQNGSFGSGIWCGNSYVCTNGSIGVGGGGNSANAVVLFTGSAATIKVPTTINNTLTGTTGKFNDLMVTNTLKAYQYDIQHVANLGGDFLVTPTYIATSGTATLTALTKSGTTISMTISDTALTNQSLGGAQWLKGAKVKVSGEIDGVVLGTCEGSLTADMNTSSHTLAVSFTYTGSDIGSISTGAHAASAVKGLTVMLTQIVATSGATTTYPVGIYLTSYEKKAWPSADSQAKPSISVYGGTSTDGTTPKVRIGSMAGLPAVNGVTPSGWGIFTDNGYFSGVIVSTEGKIGNFTIGTSALYSNAHQAYNTAVNGIYIGDDYISFGSGGVSYLKNDGTGKFGTWTLDNNSFKNGTFGTSGSVMMCTGSTSAKAIGGSASTVTGWAFTAGANFGVTNTGALYCNSANVTGAITATSLKISSGVSTVEELGSTWKNFRNVATYSYAGEQTGYIKITTPILPSRMCNIHITGYNYVSGSETIDLNISFYNYGSGIYSHGYINNGSYPISMVRVCQLSSSDRRAIIILGDTSTTWQYPKLTIDSALIAHESPPDTYAAGWTIDAPSTATLPTTYAYLTTLTDSNYITRISTTDGIKVHNAGDLTDYVQVNSSKIAIYRNSSERMQITDSAIIMGNTGTNEYNTYITTDGLQVRKGTTALSGFSGSSIWLGNSSNFSVTSEGKLTANNATINGAITATSLTLGSGVTVAASKVSGLASVATSGTYSSLSGTPDLTVYVQKDGTIGTLPASGATSSSTTGFKVSSAGLLTASNALIYGTVYASAGKFTGEVAANSGYIANDVKIGGSSGTAASTVLTNITNAATTATKYITYIDTTNGIRVYDGQASNKNVNFTQMNSSGFQVYKGGTAVANRVASFGETTTIGKYASGYKRAVIDNSSYSIYDYDKKIASMGGIYGFQIGTGLSETAEVKLAFQFEYATGKMLYDTYWSQQYLGGMELEFKVYFSSSNSYDSIYLEIPYATYDTSHSRWIEIYDFYDDYDYEDISHIVCSAVDSQMSSYFHSKYSMDITFTGSYASNIDIYVPHSSGDEEQFLYTYEINSSATPITAIQWNGSFSSGETAKAEGATSIAVGVNASASGETAQAFGNNVYADADYAHAEGNGSRALGYYSHAEGYETQASGNASHAQNYSTIANYNYQTVIGKYNNNKSNTLFEIGKGTSNTARSNAFEVSSTGNVTASGSVTASSFSTTGAISGGAISGSSLHVTGNVTGDDFMTENQNAFDAKNISSGSWTQMDPSGITLKAGHKYLIIYGAQFASNATGYRGIDFGLSADSSRYNMKVPACSGVTTKLNAIITANPATTQTYHMYAVQNSGSALQVYGYARIIKLV